jgi:hypothetical protein
MIRYLKDNGRAAIVLPDGSLTGDGVKQRIRQHFLESCNLHTIVRLPNSVFQPYASVATNLLFFTKGEPTKEIWYWEHKLPEGVKAYNKTKPIQRTEFANLKKWWKNRKENEHAWKVSYDSIIKNGYSLDFKNPHISNTDYHDPEKLIMAYEGTLRILNELHDKLNGELVGLLVNRENNKDKNNHNIKLLLNNLYLIMEIPNGIKKLREHFLTYAMQGKLVSQNTQDSPVSELLEEIELEKKRLVTSGKLKLKESSFEIKSADLPYQLPNGWEWVKILDISELKTGATPTRSNKSYYGGTIKWLVSGDIHKKEI